MGSVVATNDDALARRIFLFINKGWGYGDTSPDHYFLALNYRLSELQGAVAVAQLSKLAAGIQRRIAAAQELTRALRGLPGIETPWVSPRGIHTYWKYCLRVDSQTVSDGVGGLAQLLSEKGLREAPGLWLYLRVKTGGG